MHVKATPTEFKLSKQAGRIGLLCGITAGTVTREEAEAAILADTERRPRNKPVVVPDRNGVETRFGSIREAARFLLTQRPKQGGGKHKYALRLNAMEKYIANRCNQDCWYGFYWAE